MKTMDKEATSNLIKSRINEYLSTTKVFFTKLTSEQGAIQLIQKEVREVKKEKGEKGFSEAKGKLAKMQEMHYNMYLLDQQLKQQQGFIYEMNTLATILEVELNISEEDEEYFKGVTSASPYFFAVDKGEVVMVDNQTTDVIKQAFSEKINDEKNLKKSYDVI